MEDHNRAINDIGHTSVPEMQGLAPVVIAWEATRACNFACAHCRAEAQKVPDPRQLTTEEAFDLVDQIYSFCKPILIISGGDPLLRKDVFDVASYASARGIRVVMSPSGSNITPEVTEKMKSSGVKMLSISLDGSRPEVHDNFRQVPGAFNMTLKSLHSVRLSRLPFKVNTTVTQHNLHDLPNIMKLAIEVGAAEWDVFMLVPTGRGRITMEVTPDQYEKTMCFIYEASLTSPIPIKMTCTPQYMRMIAQQQMKTGALQPQSTYRRRMGGRGCMAGNGFCFVSHVGDVFGCGFLPVSAGNIRQQSFKQIYQQSRLFKELRNPELLKGKCGVCTYKGICGGCRARAFSVHKDYLAEEPYCTYIPEKP